MSKGLRLLETNSAILLMVFMIILNISSTSSLSIFERDPNISPILDSKETSNIESDKGGLIKRMLSYVNFDMHNQLENKQISRNRHWYFKPRRKEIDNLSIRDSTAGHKNLNHDTQKLHFLSSLTNIQNVTKPQNNSSKRAFSLLSEDLVIPSTRQKRSSDSKYKHLFASDTFTDDDTSLHSLDSKANADIWKSQKQVYQMYHRSSSSVLQILPDGNIVGESKCNEYCELSIVSVDYIEVELKTKVKIFGIQSKFYIAMSRSGKLYTTKNSFHEDTDFLHEFVQNSHDSYLSYKHRRYITMRNDVQGSSTPARSRKIANPSHGTPKRAFFLVSNISHREESPPVATTVTSSNTDHLSSAQVTNHMDRTGSITTKEESTNTASPLNKTTTSTQKPSTHIQLTSSVSTLEMTSPHPTISTITKATESSSTTISRGRSSKSSRKGCRKGKRSKRKGKCGGKKRKRGRKRKKKRKNKSKKHRGGAKERKHRSIDDLSSSGDVTASYLLNFLEQMKDENIDRILARLSQSSNFTDNRKEVS